MACSREHFVATAKKYLGYNEDDNSFMEILNIYNNGLAKAVSKWGTRSVRMWSTAHWCSCYVSAMAMAAGCDDIVPIEISCYYHRVLAQKAGIWVESDAYVPKGGDLIIYDWDDNGVGDNRGGEDHIGIVVSCDGKTITTIEGNTSGHGSGEAYKGKVAYHSRPVNGRYIRGFIVPKGWTNEATPAPAKPKEITEEEAKKIAKEVIDGKWGNGEDRKRRLEASGYNYAVIQAVVNAMLKDETPASVTYDTYTVVKGDTMYKIAKAHNMTLESLILLNPQISNPNLIYVGQKINVKEKKEEAKAKTYTVVKGDTMYKIAKANGLTLKELIAKNPQVKNPNLIYVGNVINI